MLSVDKCALVVIDIQGKLAGLMYRKESLLENARKLIKGLQVLEIPIVVTEQYPKGLGATLPEIAGLFPLRAVDRPQILVCGIETHVCVYQTTVDLLAARHHVEIVADAVSSRTAEDRLTGLQRMRDEGARITSVEMALFELMKVAQGPKFKEVSQIVK